VKNLRESSINKADRAVNPVIASHFCSTTITTTRYKIKRGEVFAHRDSKTKETAAKRDNFAFVSLLHLKLIRKLLLSSSLLSVSRMSCKNCLQQRP
jgi:hypothetical protein